MKSERERERGREREREMREGGELLGLRLWVE
jgi:hypothetical protein